MYVRLLNFDFITIQGNQNQKKTKVNQKEMGGNVSTNNQTIKINQQAMRNTKSCLFAQQPQSHTNTGTRPSSRRDESIATQCPISNSMCEKIYENNKKCSKLRNHLKIKNKSSIDVPASLYNKQNLTKTIAPRERTCILDAHSQLQQKKKYLENNKRMIESSIQATICVQRVLNILCHKQILGNDEFRYLNARNTKSLQWKQRRFRNLQAREQKNNLTQSLNNQQNIIKCKNKQSNSCHDNKNNNSSIPQIWKSQNKSKFALKKSSKPPKQIENSQF